VPVETQGAGVKHEYDDGGHASQVHDRQRGPEDEYACEFGHGGLLTEACRHDRGCQNKGRLGRDRPNGSLAARILVPSRDFTIAEENT
jgi:hypothetical protein